MDLKVYLNRLWTKFSGKPNFMVWPNTIHQETIFYQDDLENIGYGKLRPSIYPYTVTTTTKVTHNYKSGIRDPARRWRKR